MLREFIPDELITEVLSFLPVKSLMRLKCLNKSWKTLISDPAFIKLHLKRSARNKHLALFSRIQQTSYNFRVAPFPLHRLLENTSGTITVPYFPINKDRVCLNVVGSYNGLFCLVEESQFVIISLDLSSETYRQLLPPQDEGIWSARVLDSVP
ncbi:F-box protein [Trifolium medium]|uniref:F-box protein n=1 Tax=Trifolium medium TaxID=97028 RepID=A0A392MFG8_9FABA|nr:F-box protein [Trifolium medium]